MIHIMDSIIQVHGVHLEQKKMEQNQIVIKQVVIQVDGQQQTQIHHKKEHVITSHLEEKIRLETIVDITQIIVINIKSGFIPDFLLFFIKIC